MTTAPSESYGRSKTSLARCAAQRYILTSPPFDEASWRFFRPLVNYPTITSFGAGLIMRGSDHRPHLRELPCRSLNPSLSRFSGLNLLTLTASDPFLLEDLPYAARP